MVREGSHWTYEGEVDKDGLACGTGVAKLSNGRESYKGTWFKDMWWGVGKWES